MPSEGADVPSVASVLVVFFAFSVVTIVLLWLMDMLVDALRWRILGSRERYPNANQSTTTEPEDVPEGARRPWWRRIFEG